jgi:hypothetical protein
MRVEISSNAGVCSSLQPEIQMRGFRLMKAAKLSFAFSQPIGPTQSITITIGAPPNIYPSSPVAADGRR